MPLLRYIRGILLRQKHNQHVSLPTNPQKPWAICTYSGYNKHPPHHIIGQFSNPLDAFICAQQIQQAYIQKYRRFYLSDTHYITQQYNPPKEPKYSAAANHIWIRNTNIPVHCLNIADIFLVDGEYCKLTPNIAQLSHDTLMLHAIKLSILQTYTVTYQQYIVPLDMCITYTAKYVHHDPNPLHHFTLQPDIYYNIRNISSQEIYDNNTISTNNIPHIADIIETHIYNQSSLSQHEKIHQLRVLHRVNFLHITEQIPHIYTIPNTQPITR